MAASALDSSATTYRCYVADRFLYNAHVIGVVMKAVDSTFN